MASYTEKRNFLKRLAREARSRIKEAGGAEYSLHRDVELYEEIVTDLERLEQIGGDASLYSYAAPDLLEACRRLLSVVEAENEACGIYQEHQRIARNAIAKAVGADR